MEDHVVVVASLGKSSEVLASLETQLSVFKYLRLRSRLTNLGRMSVVKLDGERALVRCQSRYRDLGTEIITIEVSNTTSVAMIEVWELM